MVEDVNTQFDENVEAVDDELDVVVVEAEKLGKDIKFLQSKPGRPSIKSLNRIPNPPPNLTDEQKQIL